jgi:hypothetical protein
VGEQIAKFSLSPGDLLFTRYHDIPRSAASCPSTRQRCPVGSHATVTPAKPALPACSLAQSNVDPRSHARQRNVRRVWLGMPVRLSLRLAEPRRTHRPELRWMLSQGVDWRRPDHRRGAGRVRPGAPGACEHNAPSRAGSYDATQQIQKIAQPCGMAGLQRPCPHGPTGARAVQRLRGRPALRPARRRVGCAFDTTSWVKRPSGEVGRKLRSTHAGDFDPRLTHPRVGQKGTDFHPRNRPDLRERV